MTIGALITERKHLRKITGSVGLNVGIIVQKLQDRVVMQLGGRNRRGPRKSPLNFGADLDEGEDPGILIK